MTPPGFRFAVLCGLGLAGAILAARSAVTRAADPAAPGPIAFVDRTAAAGLAFRTTYGGKDTSTYILETTGTGVAFLDYDRDGRPDLFFANGTTLAGFPTGQAPRCALYRNNGDGTFTDVTVAAGVARSGRGQG